MRKEDTKIFRVGETSINCQGIKMEIIHGHILPVYLQEGTRKE